MPLTRPPENACPGANATAGVPCPLQCKYNLFQRGELRIDSWELKCSDCGYRVTQACRSDEPELNPDIDPARCPWCGLEGAKPGLNPCG